MLIDSQELNESDLISRKITYDENKQYFNTTIKKIKKKYSESNELNFLINSLKDFSVKYEFDDKIIPKSQKFVITFDELISLIRFSIEAQIKLTNCLKDNLKNSKNLSKEFINNLTSYINSYEKVEKINPNEKRKPSGKENIGIIANNVKRNKSINLINKSSSYWVTGKKPFNKENKSKNMKKEEKNERPNIKNKINSSNKFIKTSNSYIRGNLAQKLISPKNNKNKEKNKKFENKSKNLLNKSVERRHKAILSDFSSNEKTNISKINYKSSEKRKSGKASNNKNNKSLSIYTACENLKCTSFILKTNKNKGFSTEHFGKGETNYDSNNTNFEKKEDGKKIIYYNKSMILGVKKQIINSNMPKPSSFANKLLQNGRKYITEFNGIKEAERKKQY